MHTPFSAGRISAGSMADYLPLLTAAVSFALTALLLRQYLNRRKLHQLVWATSLGLLGLAAVLAYLGNADVVGWNEALYKAYLPLTALPAGLIGPGVLQLFRNRPALARYYAYYWIATAILVIAVTALAPLRDPVDNVYLAAEPPSVGGRGLPPVGAGGGVRRAPRRGGGAGGGP